MRYDVWLSKGGGERQIVLEDDRQLAKDDVFSYERDSYKVTSFAPSHDDFDAVVFADWIGEVGIGEMLSP